MNQTSSLLTPDPSALSFLQAAGIRRGPSSYLCGGALGIPAASNLLDRGLMTLLPAFATVIALGWAFVWMARRWGLRPAVSEGGRVSDAAASAPEVLTVGESARRTDGAEQPVLQR